MQKYALAHRELRDALTYCRHNTNGFVPRIERSARFHIPFHHIAGAQSTSAHLYQQFAAANGRIGQFHDADIIIAMVFNSKHLVHL